MRKKGILEILVRSVMSLYEGAKIKVRVDSKMSEEFHVEVGMHQGFVLSPFLMQLWCWQKRVCQVSWCMLI